MILIGKKVEYLDHLYKHQLNKNQSYYCVNNSIVSCYLLTWFIFDNLSIGEKTNTTKSLSGPHEKEENSDEDYGKCFRQPEKKRRLSVDQVQFLEKSFEEENKLEPERKIQLAKELNLQPRQVAIWFQNRRARCKTKQLEKDYDILNSSYDKLKSEFDCLQKHNEKLKHEV